MTGKWHIDAKPENVFQNVVNVRSGMPKDAWNHSEMLNKFKALHGAEIKPSTIMPIGYNRPFNEQDTTWSPTNKSLGGYWEGGKHWSAVLKDDAINFINSAKENESPFFMYLAFNAPHDPRQAPKEYLDMYPLDSITLPKSWMPEYPFKDSIGNGQNLRDEALAPFPRTEFATKKHIQEYYALITHLDSQIGDILYALKQSGKGENTYDIFTADHGLAMGKHGLLGKQNLFDHSIRAPFIIAGPQIPKGKKISYDIYLQDAMATSLGLANIEKPNYVEFNSIMGLIRGKVKKSHYNGIYGAYIDLQRMIRKDNFKLIVYPKIEKILLFDLENDPEEMHDLFDDIKYKSRVNQLFLDLIQLQKKMNDPLNMTPIYNKLNKL